jgi:hypothetical protein
VGLWVEEDLGVTHALRGGFPEIRPGQLAEVTFVKQDLGAPVVEVQEGLKVGEVVGRANIPHGSVPEPYPVASGHLEHHLRLQRAFDVNVQFRLGYPPEELVGERDIS